MSFQNLLKRTNGRGERAYAALGPGRRPDRGVSISGSPSTSEPHEPLPDSPTPTAAALTSSSGSITALNLPPTVDGEWFVAFTTIAPNGGDPPLPAGWVFIGSQFTIGKPTLYVWRRECDGTEGPTLTIGATLEPAAAVVLRVRDAFDADVYSDAESGPAAAYTSLHAPSVVTTGPSRLVCCAYVVGGTDAGSVVAIQPPLGQTELAVQAGNDIDRWVKLVVAYEFRPVAGATGPRVAKLVGADDVMWVGATLALEPFTG